MPNLPSWAILSLREPLTVDELVAKARALGVRADSTRDGIQLPYGFLARIEAAPFPARLLDRSIAETEVVVGPATLHVSGGTNDVARSEHQQPPEIRAAAKEGAAKAAAMLGYDADSSKIESAASRKMWRLTELVRSLAPLATSLVMPQANHLVLASDAFVAMAESYADESGYPFPLWSFLKVRDDEGVGTIASTGMWCFGLPDVGIALPEGEPRDAYVLAIGALQREMVAEGWWPEDGAAFTCELGEFRIRRVWDAVWMSPKSLAVSVGAALAERRFARLRQLGLLLGPHTHHHRAAERGLVAVEHFLRVGESSLAVTNGLSDAPQPGGTAEDENDFVEITVTSRALGPWADGWLAWLVESLRGHDPSRPIRGRDRLVLPETTRGIAGAIVWPMGHLKPLGPNDPTVQLWDAIPILPTELAAFRETPGAQAAWMSERVERDDIAEIQTRWTAQAIASRN